MKEPRWVTSFKTRWNIPNNRDFMIIMLAFSLAGMGISIVRPIEFNLLHLDQAPVWVRIITYPFLIVPTYYAGLLFFGFLLGQFDFSKRFALNSFQRIGRLFHRLTGTAPSK